MAGVGSQPIGGEEPSLKRKTPIEEGIRRVRNAAAGRRGGGSDPYAPKCLEEEFSEVRSLLASYGDPRDAFRNAWETVVL
jgi:hypothetical protein